MRDGASRIDEEASYACVPISCFGEKSILVSTNLPLSPLLHRAIEE